MLTYDTLREANKKRISQFKNKHGEAAHSREDGSDWDFATWLMATMGELGEAAKARIDLEADHIDFETYTKQISDELADVSIYLDLLAMRSFDLPKADIKDNDETTPYLTDARLFMLCISLLGQAANDCKKVYRGDMSSDEYVFKKQKCIESFLVVLATLQYSRAVKGEPSQFVHASGINLAQAIVNKFNIVSDRVGADVKIESTGHQDPVSLYGVTCKS